MKVRRKRLHQTTELLAFALLGTCASPIRSSPRDANAGGDISRAGEFWHFRLRGASTHSEAPPTPLPLNCKDVVTGPCQKRYILLRFWHAWTGVHRASRGGERPVR